MVDKKIVELVDQCHEVCEANKSNSDVKIFCKKIKEFVESHFDEAYNISDYEMLAVAIFLRSELQSGYNVTDAVNGATKFKGCKENIKEAIVFNILSKRWDVSHSSDGALRKQHQVMNLSNATEQEVFKILMCDLILTSDENNQLSELTLSNIISTQNIDKYIAVVGEVAISNMILIQKMKNFEKNIKCEQKKIEESQEIINTQVKDFNKKNMEIFAIFIAVFSIIGFNIFQLAESGFDYVSQLVIVNISLVSSIISLFFLISGSKHHFWGIVCANGLLILIILVIKWIERCIGIF